MEVPDLTALVREAEAGLAKSRPLSRAEVILLLASELLARATRKEKKYGQP